MPPARSGPWSSASRKAARWRCCSPPRTRNARSRSCCSGRAPAGSRRPTTPGRRAPTRSSSRRSKSATGAWGTLAYAAEQIREWAAPTQANDERAIAWLAEYLRNAASPGAAIALARMNRGIDVRPALAAIHVPTLVLARDADPTIPGSGDAGGWPTRSTAPGSRPSPASTTSSGSVTRNGCSLRSSASSHLSAAKRPSSIGSWPRCCSPTSSARRPGPRELGDKAWGEVVQRHHGTVRALLARYRGREVDTTGDGFFATFDGPARAVRCAQAIVDAVRGPRARGSGGRAHRARSKRSPARSAGSR